VTVFGSSRTPTDHPDYVASVAFGRRMAEAGWIIVTGAGGGILEAAHVGAGPTMSMGVKIMLPFEEEANSTIIPADKRLTFRFFFTRKLMFDIEVHAVVFFPGGFGTQDELFEVLTLLQTGKRDPLPIIRIDAPGGTYWKAWYEFVRELLLDRNMLSAPDLSLLRITDSVDEAVDEKRTFDTVFDSIRSLHERLVMRLHTPIDDALLNRINEEFRDILESGRIERTQAAPDEMDQEHLSDLPRIALHLNRRDTARLRQLIDVINHGGTEMRSATVGESAGFPRAQ
jgi:hypothetical protein